MTRFDLETRLRRELAATTGRGNFDGAGACVDGLTNEALDLCTLWVVDPSLSPDHQQKIGIRLSIRYRGYIRSSWVSVASWMKQARWVRTTFLRTRGSSDQWALIENRVDVTMTHGTSYSDIEIETATFVQPRVYMASFAADGKGFHRKDPPNSTKTQRLNAFTWNPTLRDVRDVDIGTQFKEQVEPKLQSKKELHPDPVSPSSTEYTYEYGYESSFDESQDDENPIHGKSEGDCKIEHAGFMAFSSGDSDSDVVVISHDAPPVQQDSQDLAPEVAFTSHVMPQ